MLAIFYRSSDPNKKRRHSDIIYDKSPGGSVLFNASNLSDDLNIEAITDFSVNLPVGQVCSLNISAPFEKLVVADTRKGYKSDQFVKASLNYNTEEMDTLDGAKCLSFFADEVALMENSPPSRSWLGRYL